VQAINKAVNSAGQRFQDTGISVEVAEATAKDGSSAWIIKFGGSKDRTVSNVKLRATDPSFTGSLNAILADFSPWGGFSVGGLVVRNDVRGAATALVLRGDVTTGALTVKATDAAIIEADVDSVVEATGGLTGGGLADRAGRAVRGEQSGIIARHCLLLIVHLPARTAHEQAGNHHMQFGGCIVARSQRPRPRPRTAVTRQSLMVCAAEPVTKPSRISSVCCG
jgi:hypothetical protein